MQLDSVSYWQLQVLKLDLKERKQGQKEKARPGKSEGDGVHPLRSQALVGVSKGTVGPLSTSL